MSVKIKNMGRNIKALFDGVVGEDITPQDALDIVSQSKNVDAVTIQINSPGGYITEGWAIFNILSEIKDKLTIEVIGLAASMASVISLAGSRLIMRQGTYFMIHEPWSGVLGTAKDMRDTADVLDKMKEDILDLYVQRTNLNKDELNELVKNETWLNEKEALEYGFCDAIDENYLPVAASIKDMKFKNIPRQLMEIVEQKNEKVTNIVDDYKENLIIEEKEEMSDKVENTSTINVDEIVNAVMAKIPAGRDIEEAEPMGKLDKWFADYLINKAEPKNATVKTTDGYGIPTLIDTEVFKRRGIGSFMRREVEGLTSARVRKYASDSVVTFKSNPTAEIIAEGADYPDNSDKGEPITFNAYKMGSIYSVTEEVNEDTLLSVVADFQDDAGKALAKLENSYFVSGTGTGQPEGIMIGGTQVTGLTGVTTTGISYDALVDFDEKLPEEYRVGSFYMMNSNTRAKLRKIKDDSNRPIMQEYSSGLFSLFGRPIIINEELDDFGASKKVMVLGNREGYGVGDRTSGMKVRISENTKNGSTEVRWSVRLDGKVIDATAFQVLVTPAS